MLSNGTQTYEKNKIKIKKSFFWGGKALFKLKVTKSVDLMVKENYYTYPVIVAECLECLEECWQDFQA